MTAGEFIRKLTALVHEEGYTLNNTEIVDIYRYKDCIEVEIEDSKGNGTIIYID